STPLLPPLPVPSPYTTLFRSHMGYGPRHQGSDQPLRNRTGRIGPLRDCHRGVLAYCKTRTRNRRRIYSDGRNRFNQIVSDDPVPRLATTLLMGCLPTVVFNRPTIDTWDFLVHNQFL